LPLQGASALANADRFAGSQQAARNPCSTFVAVLFVYWQQRHALPGQFCVNPELNGKQHYQLGNIYEYFVIDDADKNCNLKRVV
jgi:hypothetical protein